MVRRYAIAGGLAFVVACGLFLVMQSLVAMGEAKLEDDKGGRVIDFVRVRAPSETRTKKRELPQKKPTPKQPPAPELKMNTNASSAGPTVAIAAPEVDHSVKLGGPSGLGGAYSDGDEVPLVRVEPIYPPRAAERRIEGWVQLEFTIGETGQVVDPAVVAAEPRGVFERAATRAVRKWKYRPKIRDGVAVPTHGVQVKLTFKLSGS